MSMIPTKDQELAALRGEVAVLRERLQQAEQQRDRLRDSIREHSEAYPHQASCQPCDVCFQADRDLWSVLDGDADDECLCPTSDWEVDGQGVGTIDPDCPVHVDEEGPQKDNGPDDTYYEDRLRDTFDDEDEEG